MIIIIVVLNIGTVYFVMRIGEDIMKLSDLISFKTIAIQCHDNPDADAIASGYGLYLFFISHGIKVKLVYTGGKAISKSNLKLLVSALKIPIEHVSELEQIPELLITVDCQYGEGNVGKLIGNHIAIIDHHHDCNRNADFKVIRESYGSCSTLVYRMLLEEGYPVMEDKMLVTALYYGLYMDTNAFSEIKHPFDMDMIEELVPEEKIFTQLKNSNFSFQELEIASLALLRYTYDETLRFAVIRANPCDPNLLGFIADLFLQVENVDTSIVYCEYEYGFKLSIRNCNEETTANEIAKYIVKDMGTSGGHKNKAGAYIIKSFLEERCQDIMTYLLNRVSEYFNSYDVTNKEDCKKLIHEMEVYEGRPVSYGMCESTHLGTPGEMLHIRTISKEFQVEISEDTYLLASMYGDVIPVDREWFTEKYEITGSGYECNSEYKPHIRVFGSRSALCIKEHIRCCRRIHPSRVYAKQLTKATKIYCDPQKIEYMLGEPSDYLIVREEDLEVKIMTEEIFHKYYRKQESVI